MFTSGSIQNKDSNLIPLAALQVSEHLADGIT